MSDNDDEPTRRKCPGCNWEFDGTDTHCNDCRIDSGNYIEVEPIVSGNVTYYAWSDGRAVGYRAVHTDGRVEYIYLNPSQADDREGDAYYVSPDNEPNVFVYTGTTGNIAHDEPHVHFNMFERE